MEQVKYIFRWIFVLPGAFTSLFLSYALIKLFTTIQSWFIGANPDSPFSLIVDNIFIAFASGFVFVYFGTKIAPSHKKVVAYVLAAITLVMFGLFLQYNGIWENIGIFFTAVGAGFGLYQINTGELNVEGDVFKFE